MEVIRVGNRDLGGAAGDIVELNGELDSPGLSNSSSEGCLINERNINFGRQSLCRSLGVICIQEVNSEVSIATWRRNLLDTGGLEQGGWQRFRNGGGYPEDHRIIN